MRIWSEIPRRRTQELVADIATIVWVILWVSLGIRLYNTLAEFSGVGTSIRDTGTGIENAGDTIGETLSQIPLIGEGAANLISEAFGGLGAPLVQAGADLERLLLIIAAVLGTLLIAVFLIPWLFRYLPWRRERWQRLNAGNRAIRRATAPAADLERVLATRAMARLEYAELLDHTPDPIGDFTSGRFDRLARAELNSVGLVPKGGGSG